MRNRLKTKREYLTSLINLYKQFEFYAARNTGKFYNKMIYVKANGEQVIFTKESLAEYILKVKNS